MEYIMRTVQVAVIFLTVVTLLGATALIPAYVKVSDELADVEALRDKEAFEREVEEYKNAEMTLTDTARELSLLRKKILEFPVTDTITGVVSARPVGVAVRGISYERSSRTFIVEGIAGDRNALVSYRRALEEREGVGEVTSPIANLAKSTNLPFQLSFTLESTTTPVHE